MDENTNLIDVLLEDEEQNNVLGPKKNLQYIFVLGGVYGGT